MRMILCHCFLKLNSTFKNLHGFILLCVRRFLLTEYFLFKLAIFVCGGRISVPSVKASFSCRIMKVMRFSGVTFSFTQNHSMQSRNFKVKLFG